jgi:hypothetical protein
MYFSSPPERSKRTRTCAFARQFHRTRRDSEKGCVAVDNLVNTVAELVDKDLFQLK